MRCPDGCRRAHRIWYVGATRASAPESVGAAEDVGPRAHDRIARLRPPGERETPRSPCGHTGRERGGQRPPASGASRSAALGDECKGAGVLWPDQQLRQPVPVERSSGCRTPDQGPWPPGPVAEAGAEPPLERARPQPPGLRTGRPAEPRRPARQALPHRELASQTGPARPRRPRPPRRTAHPRRLPYWESAGSGRAERLSTGVSSTDVQTAWWPQQFTR